MSRPYQDLLAALAEKIGLDPGGLIATEEVVIDDLSIGLRQDFITQGPDILDTAAFSNAGTGIHA